MHTGPVCQATKLLQCDLLKRKRAEGGKSYMGKQHIRETTRETHGYFFF
jgi:hypothetical protein